MLKIWLLSNQGSQVSGPSFLYERFILIIYWYSRVENGNSHLIE